MADGSMSKQGDMIARRADGTTFDLASVMEPANVGGGTTSVTDAAASVAVSTACTMVLVQAATTNGSVMYLGGSAAQPIELYAGQYVILPISNANKLYVKMGAGLTGTANYLIFA